ncbi:hypothetical protein [Hydrogenophaga crocea]|uniref:Uncharacterized protein n=1 Tax=Hydrogenophaga crocea TaxID=2716225 RepID=A0A6G8IES0_9BURK|nr:hypothetical protein [Hydrogenophaga crocea]QIM51611.1 hypothetical protein G9Q37_05395 [Hydrogenophaga crocea]
MTCEACQEAENNPLTGLINAGCKGCAARSLAKSPDYCESVRIKDFSPAYRKALQTTFGEDRAKGHEMVKEWAERLKGAQ